VSTKVLALCTVKNNPLQKQYNEFSNWVDRYPFFCKHYCYKHLGFGIFSLHFINNCPTRCNTKQSIYYSASSLYRFRVSTTSGVHKTLTATSVTVQLPPSKRDQVWPRLEGGSFTKNMTSAGGCSYSFVYSWWWVWLKSEICRVKFQYNK